MLGCVLDFNIDDLQLPDIEAMLVRMEPVFRLAEGDEWHIDCRGCHYLGPSAAVPEGRAGTRQRGWQQ